MSIINLRVMSIDYIFRKTQLLLLLLLGTGGVFAQQVITGTVTDGTSPLPGVSVLEKGTNRGTQTDLRSEEHTSELQSPLRISYAVCCLKKKKTHTTTSNLI